MSDLVITKQDPEPSTDGVRVLSHQLSGFAVLKCECGASDPIVIPTLTAVASCSLCRASYCIGGAVMTVDPRTRKPKADMQIGRLSTLVSGRVS